MNREQATDSKPRRIAWLVRGGEGYGVRRAIESLVGAVAQRGYQPIVVCLQHAALAERCAAVGAQTHVLNLNDPPALGGSLGDKWRGWRALRQYERDAIPAIECVLRAANAHAVHVLWPNMVALAGRVARRLGVPCVWEMPNVLGATVPMRLSRFVYQWQCWRWGVLPLANSAYTAASLGHCPVRPRVCHLGVDAHSFDPQHVQAVERASLGIAPDATVLGIVARLTSSKGQARILEAMAKLIREGEDLHLVLIGGPIDTAHADELRARAEQHGVADRVHLIGEVADPQRYYHLMDVAINSRVDAEPFGLSVVEAMMMGRPVAVHALGGPTETVRDGETGWHVHDPSIESWTVALRRVLDDRPNWRAMGDAARRDALARFSLEAQAERYLGALEAIAVSRRGDS